MNINTSLKKIKKSYSKNFPEIQALFKKMYPEFVYASNSKSLKNEIPVFTFHTVKPDKFEEQLFFLSRNNYATLSADEFYECIAGNKPIRERSILLTFDDGWENVYSHVFPILNKYRMKAVCFLIPGLIDNININDRQTDVRERGPNSNVLCTWDEIKEMHQSGVIDFQSHSMYHNQIFVSSVIDDFFYPSFDSFAYNFNIPLYKVNKIENILRETKLGTPIYRHASKFSGKKRYLDDENLRNDCIEYVQLNGGEEFFKSNNWRKILLDKVRKYKMEYKDSGYFEDEEHLRENLLVDFSESKKIIEKKLSGKIVNHFCYPWWQGSNLAVEISKNAGYLTNFWGLLSGRRTNRPGDNPFQIARLLTDDYLFRLPGEGRKSLRRIIKEKVSDNYTGFTSKLMQTDF